MLTSPGPWWPPQNCYHVDAEIVDDIVCQNSCSNCKLEICEDLQTGQQWWHIPIRRHQEFVECTGRVYSTCGGATTAICRSTEARVRRPVLGAARRSWYAAART